MSETTTTQPTGAGAQPVAAERTRRLLHMVRLGFFAGLASVVCFLMTSRTLLRLGDQDRIWPTVANVAATAACIFCLLQWWVWHQALQEWLGRKDVALAGWLAPSRAVAWLAGLAGIIGPFAAAQVVRTTARAEAAHWWALAGGLLLVVCVAFGCLHPLVPAGPRGVLPQVITRNLRDRRFGAHEDPDADTLVLGRHRIGPAE